MNIENAHCIGGQALSREKQLKKNTKKKKKKQKQEQEQKKELNLQTMRFKSDVSLGYRPSRDGSY